MDPHPTPMEPIRTETSAGFEAIRRQLDPAYRYLIFEQQLAAGETIDYTEVINTLNVLGLKRVQWKLHINRPDGVGWLVVRFSNDRLGGVMEKLLRAGIGRKMKIFAYGSRAGAPGNGG